MYVRTKSFILLSCVHQLIHGFAITNNLFPIPFAIRKNSQCSTSMNFDYNNMFLHEINYSEVKSTHTAQPS